MSDLKLALIVEAIDAFSRPLGRLGEAFQGPMRVARQGFARMAEDLESVTSKFEGVAAAIGAGFEVREVIAEDDTFRRLAVDAGVAGERIEQLRERIYDAAERSGAPLAELEAGFREMFDRVGLNQSEASIDALATSIQRLGGKDVGGPVGELFGMLEKISGLKGPDELVKSMAILREQVGPHAAWLADFARVAPELLDAYRMQGVTGLAAVRDIGALYATIRPVVPRPLAAAASIQTILDAVADVNKAGQLQSLGIHVLGRDQAEANANLLLRTRRPMSEYLPELMKAYESPQLGFLLDQVLGPQVRDVLAKTTLDELTGKLKAIGDSTAFMRESAEDARTLSSSLNSLATALTRVADVYLSGPLQGLADLMRRFPGLTAAMIEGFGGLAILGLAAGWIGNLWRVGVVFTGWAASAVAVIGDFFVALAAGYPVLEAFGVALAANPVGAFLLAVGALATAGYEVYAHWDKVRALFGEIGELWTKLTSLMPSASDFLGSNFGAAPVGAGGSPASALWGYGAPLPGLAERGAAHWDGRGPRAEGDFTFRFENLPPGTRVTSQRTDANTNVNLDLGYQMAFP